MRVQQEEPLCKSSEDFPRAAAYLEGTETGFLWRIQSCPVCGRSHVHGAGGGRKAPTSSLGHRAGHCLIPNRGYLLFDADPERTAALIAEVHARC